jgi:uncharacterized protein (DUF924 family)
MDPQAQRVLDFWFGVPGSAEYGRNRPEWFRKDPAFDALIAQRFGTTIDAALAGALHGWADDTTGTLALIVVLDQFTRNSFRATPRAFAGDALAQALAQRLVAAGGDAQLPPFQRAFAYLPFEHAEDLVLQQESVRRFEALAAEDPEQDQGLDYARRHHAVIARFGRFPHRNAVLGRVDTAEETAFLRELGSRF